ncbi:MAG TPA: nitroreductase family deazaflavin-dependent oxidoreductase [Acidimicrobiia bacterium]
MDRIPSAVLVTPVLRLHQAIYRGSRGWLGRWLIGRSTLLLTTLGRRTGRQRTNALIYYKDGTSWVVVASNGGSDHSPGWLANLRSEPQVVVQVGRKKWSATARVASPDERARLWPLVNRHNRGFAPLLHPGARGRYDAYQRGTSREIPIVILDPTNEATVPHP